MVFACGPKGISANLVGLFAVRVNEKGDDQLDVGDGTNHVHVDWARVRRVEVGTFHGEGLLSFFDGADQMFKFYSLEGPFPNSVENFSRSLE